MSRMLTLFGDGLQPVARPSGSGLEGQARPELTLRTDAPDEETVAALRAAAVLAMAAERYRTARSRLRAAIALAPTDAGLWYDLARAHEDDPRGCDRKAARRYQKAAQLNADEPKYKAALGRAMVRINELRNGVRVLCRAAAAAPTDLDVLGVVAEGLREAGRAELAFQVLSKARFLAPADAGIERLWTRAKYDMLAERQRGPVATRRNQQSATLPLLRVFSEAAQPASGRVRRDSITHPPTPHIARLRAFRSDMG